jgi:hypothetical protein
MRFVPGKTGQLHRLTFVPGEIIAILPLLSYTKAKPNTPDIWRGFSLNKG